MTGVSMIVWCRQVELNVKTPSEMSFQSRVVSLAPSADLLNKAELISVWKPTLKFGRHQCIEYYNNQKALFHLSIRYSPHTLPP